MAAPQGKKSVSGPTLSPQNALALADRLAKATPGTLRIVVLGGGFGGVFTARALAKLLKRRNDVEVELLSENNYFTFQPLLPEVAAGGIAPTHVVNPIRELLPSTKFRLCRVRSIDFATRSVVVSQGEATELSRVAYDYLVFALGKVSDFSTMPGVQEHALPLKTLGDAFRLKNHVLRCLELAAIEENEQRRRALLSFVVAGGGFSGVETIGELWELVERSRRCFPDIRPEELTFQIVHSTARVLPEMPEKLGNAAGRELERRGIELVLGERVRAASPDAVHLKGGRTLPCRTFVCTVGNAPNPIVTYALDAGDFQVAQHRGRPIGAFACEATLRCVDKSRFFAVGDCAGVPSPSGEGLCPPTAQFAIRQAETCARNIVATIDDKPLTPFSFKALGMLASLGNRSAVADMMGIRFSGFVAWFAWRTVYLMKLPGFVRKLRVALDWTLDLFFPRDITQLQVAQLDRLSVYHFEPGEFVVRAGDMGREVYVMVAGEVEVLGGGNGAENEVIATLGPKEVFGERALLEDAKRTASVRAKTPVDVMVLSRNDFRSVVGQMPALGDYFDRLMRERYPELPAAPIDQQIHAE